MNEDFEKRKEDFLKDYKDLIDKYQIDILSFPTYIPNERGTFELRVMNDLVDKKDMGTPSPFMA